MSGANQYLVYTALALGSIGAYGALNPCESDSTSVEELISEATTTSDGVSYADLTTILVQLTKKMEDYRSNVVTRLTDVETSADTLSQNFDVIDEKVAENIRVLGDITPRFQEDISTNKSIAAGFGLTADGNASMLTNTIEPILEDLKQAVKDLRAEDVEISTRISTIEDSRVLEDSERTTMSTTIGENSDAIGDHASAITAIEEDLIDNYAPKIQDNTDDIGDLIGELSYLQQGIRRNVNEDLGVDEVVCYDLFRAARAAISLDDNPLRLGDSLDDTFMLYLSASANTIPSGYGFTGTSARMRVYDGSTTGFVIENSSDEALFSVRGSDALTAVYGKLYVDGAVYIQEKDTDALFSHVINISRPAIRQTQAGDTYVGSTGSVVLRSSDSDMLSIDSNGTTIKNELTITGTEKDTVFNSSGDNYISAASGRSTYFRSGSSATVSIEDKEVVIDGTRVLAAIKSLESDIKSFENDTSYVKHGNSVSYWIQGHNDNWGKELSYNGNTTTWSTDNTRMDVRFHKN